GRRVESIVVGALLLHAYNDTNTIVSSQRAVELLVWMVAPVGAWRFIPMSKARGVFAPLFDNQTSIRGQRSYPSVRPALDPRAQTAQLIVEPFIAALDMLDAVH